MKKEYNAKLLVEGNNDKHVVYALAESYKLPENFDVVDCDGIENVYRQLAMRLTNPSTVRAIGIVVDADNDVCSKIEKFLCVLSPCHAYEKKSIKQTVEGIVLEPIVETYPKVGLWVMPNNQDTGMLENFVMNMANEEDKQLLEKADEVLDELKKKGLQRFKEVQRPKAKVHTFLAWQKTPGIPMGQAITSRALDVNSEIPAKFVEWLKRLFQ